QPVETARRLSSHNSQHRYQLILPFTALEITSAKYFTMLKYCSLHYYNTLAHRGSIYPWNQVPDDTWHGIPIVPFLILNLLSACLLTVWSFTAGILHLSFTSIFRYPHAQDAYRSHYPLPTCRTYKIFYLLARTTSAHLMDIYSSGGIGASDTCRYAG
ncbi:hypothetical protein EX30DRAFT_385753, partial [Ascodesmis nigricans]